MRNKNHCKHLKIRSLEMKPQQNALDEKRKREEALLSACRESPAMAEQVHDPGNHKREVHARMLPVVEVVRVENAIFQVEIAVWFVLSTCMDDATRTATTRGRPTVRR